ncbi:MAG TPA: hypothetical protein VL990_12490 [Acidobacteriaceae bacterium]|nr:hypothetical protein [Acidobacteriaceae bacterium]
MHDLIFAVAFVAMVASPAMVAALGGRKEYEPGPELPSLHRDRSEKKRPAVRPRSIQRVIPSSQHLVVSDGPTLPMHNARGMANR